MIVERKPRIGLLLIGSPVSSTVWERDRPRNL